MDLFAKLLLGHAKLIALASNPRGHYCFVEHLLTPLHGEESDTHADLEDTCEEQANAVAYRREDEKLNPQEHCGHRLNLLND